eukprot:g3008.t1
MRDDAEHRVDGPPPRLILCILTGIFCLVYLDRGVIASNSVNGKKRSEEDPDGSGFQGEFDLTNFADGLLSSLFMVGILIGSPLFSQAIYYFNPFRLVGAGAIVWVVATACCGLSIDFYTLALCRTFVGFGEAGVIAIGPTYIDDKAPPDKVTLWLGILYLAIPGGYALGYLFGAAIGGSLGWRAVFIGEALLMIPFIIFCFTTKPISLNMGQEMDSDEIHSTSHLSLLWNQTKAVLEHRVYFIALIANTVHVGVLGVLSYWGAKAAKAMFHMRGTDIWIGASVVFTGTIGSLSGGHLLDRIGSTIPNAMYISGWTDILAAFIMAPSFLFIKNFAAFYIPFLISFTLMFVNMAPTTGVQLWAVPLHLRPLATSLMIIVNHLLGDLPSPALFGLTLDVMEDEMDKSENTAYRVGIFISSIFILIAGFIFFTGVSVGKVAKDYRVRHPSNEDEEKNENESALLNPVPAELADTLNDD